MSGYILSEDELLLKNTVRDFADNEIAPRAAGYDESGNFPHDNFEGLGNLGLLGLTLDEDYGGSGGTFRQVAIAVEEIARGLCGDQHIVHRAPVAMRAVHKHVGY